ncbi:MAG: alpha/beta hydrolase [Microbacteriaceae bacterium]|jgi:cis-3-alkyl-4-acyloxetan-2-one decarboxylase|nr:alpha/beta hydrolase [Microbacteriaceae bacterium]
MGFFDVVFGARAPKLHVAVDEGRGHPVILIHGLASSSATFDLLVPLLRDHHRVISLDLLGFGQSPSPATATYTLDEHVAALDRTIRSLKLPSRATLVGHSLGALIGARYAAQNPAMLSHLILVSPPVYIPGNTVLDPLERLQMDAYQRLYDFMRHNRTFTEAAARASSLLMPMKGALEVTEKNWRAVRMSLEKCIESQTTITDLAQVRVPVDAIWGTRDPFMSPAGLRVLERMRGIASRKVAGADHVIRPKFAQEIAGLVDNPSPPTRPIRVVKGRV